MMLADALCFLSPEQERPSSTHSLVTQNGTHTRNVVLFGETGVGKSSLINLIADKHIAQTSNDALGCTLEPRSYDVALPFDSGDPKSNSVDVTLWDTAGLDEGTFGAVPATAAAARLETLLRALARTPSGVHLLLFCIRGTSRLTGALMHQYDLVYASMCHRKVPIALVVTGLEHLHPHEPATVGMERWWTTHVEELRLRGMVFDAHACVTTVEAEGAVQERRMVSQGRLRELIVDYTCQRTDAWRIEPSWFSVMVSALWNWFQIQIGRGSTDGDSALRDDDSIGCTRLVH